jgi:hypothetical protein
MELTKEDIDLIHQTRSLLDELKHCRELRETINKKQRTEQKSVFESSLDCQTEHESKRLIDLLRVNTLLIRDKFPLFFNQVILTDFWIHKGSGASPETRTFYDTTPNFVEVSYRGCRSPCFYILKSISALFDKGLERQQDKAKGIEPVHYGFEYFLKVVVDLLKMFYNELVDKKAFLETLKSQSGIPVVEKEQ